MVKIKVEKRDLFWVGLIILVGAIVGVYAFVNPTTGVGHSYTELQGCASANQILKWTGSSWSCVESGISAWDTTTPGEISYDGKLSITERQGSFIFENLALFGFPVSFTIGEGIFTLGSSEELALKAGGNIGMLMETTGESFFKKKVTFEQDVEINGDITFKGKDLNGGSIHNGYVFCSEGIEEISTTQFKCLEPKVNYGGHNLYETNKMIEGNSLTSARSICVALGGKYSSKITNTVTATSCAGLFDSNPTYWFTEGNCYRLTEVICNF